MQSVCNVLASDRGHLSPLTFLFPQSMFSLRLDLDFVHDPPISSRCCCFSLYLFHLLLKGFFPPRLFFVISFFVRFIIHFCPGLPINRFFMPDVFFSTSTYVSVFSSPLTLGVQTSPSLPVAHSDQEEVRGIAQEDLTIKLKISVE